MPPWRAIGLASAADFAAVLDAAPWEQLAWAGLQTEGDNNPVEDFVDQTGNLNDFSQTNASFQPTLRTTGLNNQAALEFDGSNDLLLGQVTLTTNWSMMIICEPHQGLAGSRVYWGNNLSNPALRFTDVDDFRWRGNSGAFIRTIAAAATVEAHLIMIQSEGGTGRTRCWYDGALVFNDTGDQNYNAISINRLFGNTFQEVDGLLATAGIVLNYLWSDNPTARATVEAWAKETYAVPIP